MKNYHCTSIQKQEFSPSPSQNQSTQHLRYLRDEQLESELKQLMGRERHLLHLILKHIQEVDRRKLYAARAFSSLYEYLTKFMGYSSSAAQRRIQAARLLNHVPELSLEIQQGSVNLSQIGILTQAVKCKESQTGEKLPSSVKKEILFQIRQKSSSETQVLVAQKLDLPIIQPERKILQKDQSCLLTITLSKQQQSKLQRCRELLAAKLQQNKKDFSTVNFLEELMDFYLNKKDRPFSKMKTVANQTTYETENIAAKGFSGLDVEDKKSTFKTKNTIQKSPERQLSLKKQVFQKWDCCQFQDPLTKRTCGEKFQLEIEHLQPRWAGGTDSVDNRTLLCRTHNQWKYLQQSGRS